MLKKRIIPCLDVKDGRVVKGINFVDLVDAGDPVEQASVYNQNGADEICFLDITASSDKRDILLDTVQKTAECCFVPFLLMSVKIILRMGKFLIFSKKSKHESSV